MSNLKAIKRETTSSGSINELRKTGYIPAILYGGKDPNQKISIEKKAIRDIINSDSFLSKVLEIEIGGTTQGEEFDLLSVTDDVALAGTLNVVLIE